MIDDVNHHHHHHHHLYNQHQHHHHICVSTHQEGAEEDEGDKIQIGELAPTQGARFLVFR